MAAALIRLLADYRKTMYFVRRFGGVMLLATL
jgi:hypothetical protein